MDWYFRDTDGWIQLMIKAFFALLLILFGIGYCSYKTIDFLIHNKVVIEERK